MIQTQRKYNSHGRHHSCDSGRCSGENFDYNQSYISETTLGRMTQQHDAKTVVGDDDNSFKRNFLFSSWSTVEKLYSKYSFAVVLENKGNTARDHLGKSQY